MSSFGWVVSTRALDLEGWEKVCWFATKLSCVVHTTGECVQQQPFKRGVTSKHIHLQTKPVNHPTTMMSMRTTAPCTQRPFTAAAVRPSCITARRSLVVVAVKPTAAADFRSMADEDLVMKIVELKQDLARTRFIRVSVRPVPCVSPPH